MNQHYRDLRNLPDFWRIQRLTARNRKRASSLVETRLVDQRERVGRRVGPGPSGQRYVLLAPESAATSIAPGRLPELAGKNLTATLLAASLRSSGALIVRELYTPAQVAHLERVAAVENCEPDLRDPRLGCSTHTLFELLEVYRDCGLLDVIRSYHRNASLIFGERTKLRTHLRSRDQQAAIPWHQDAAFFGKQRGAVNCWAAITPCGRDNPGLSIVPRRFDKLVGWDDAGAAAPLDYGATGSREEFESVTDTETPFDCVLEPGDAILFDEMTVHRTLPRPWRREDQVVSITWFFPAPAFPDWGTPLAF